MPAILTGRENVNEDRLVRVILVHEPCDGDGNNDQRRHYDRRRDPRQQLLFFHVAPTTRKKPGVSRASSFQNGRLFLLMIGFLIAVLAIALILLGGRLVVALRRGLRGFIRAALVWIVHMKDFRVKRLKEISQGYPS
jgi:hypothetical protein